MHIAVRFWSYFADLAGTETVTLDLPVASTVRDALEKIHREFPRLAPAKKSTLVAVGVDYAPPEQVLRENDELSLFPPVQGG